MSTDSLLKYDMINITMFYEQQILGSGDKDPSTYMFTLLKGLKTQKMLAKNIVSELEGLPIYADKVRDNQK